VVAPLAVGVHLARPQTLTRRHVDRVVWSCSACGCTEREGSSDGTAERRGVADLTSGIALDTQLYLREYLSTKRTAAVARDKNLTASEEFRKITHRQRSDPYSCQRQLSSGPEAPLTRRPHDARPVYVEFPDFGFGPAAAAVALINGVDEPYDWHLVSSGSAAEFARAHLPGATYHQIDTFDPASWGQFRKLAPRGALTVSITNPDFAAWAAGHGYAVGIVDTLAWMWSSLPDGVDQTEFCLAQMFFGETGKPSREHPPTKVVGPIIDPSLWRATGRAPTSGTAVIGFGGMHVPLSFGDRLVADYTRWFLRAALPVLLDQSDITKVVIVGGRRDLRSLVPRPWSRHRAVVVSPWLPQPSYARLLQSSTYLLLSPGLGTLYECAASGLAPLLQPGWNMSMLLQAYHVASSYKHLCPWPWLDEAADHISDLPEHDGLVYLATRIQQTIQDDERKPESLLVEPILRYLELGGLSEPLHFDGTDELPTASKCLSDRLRSLP
jgi:hypothetical protein